MGTAESFLIGTFKDDQSRDGTRVGRICYNKQMLFNQIIRGSLNKGTAPTVKSHVIRVQNASKLGEKA